MTRSDLSRNVDVSIAIFKPDPRLLERTFESLVHQGVRRLWLYNNDGSSFLQDVTLDVLEQCGLEVHVLGDGVNVGFAAAHNAALQKAFSSGASHVLVLNPDVALEPWAIETLVEFSGRLSDLHLVSAVLRLGLRGDFNSSSSDRGPELVDSAGITWTRTGRHLDLLQGTKVEDALHGLPPMYETSAITGALVCVPLAAHARVVDTSGEFFDELFFAYREDAELGLRARQCGVGSFIVREVLATHFRGSPGTDRSSGTVNRLGVQNRFLMLWKTGLAGRPGSLARSLARDVAVVVAVHLREPSSLRGLYRALGLRPREVAKRRVLRERLQAPDALRPIPGTAALIREATVRAAQPWVVIPIFDPNLEELDQTIVELSPVANIVLVDDGSRALVETLSSIESCSILASEINGGIAAALNAGISYALSWGGAVITTLDQDSHITHEALSQLVRRADGPECAIVGPRIGAYGSASRKEGLEEAKEIMQSGMTAHSTVYTMLGMFDEGLFIDGVDSDFCLRARRAGLRVAVDQGARLEHRLGSGRDKPLFSLWGFRPLATEHAPIRRYYMNRNRLQLLRRHGRSEPGWAAVAARRTFVSNILSITVESPRLKNLGAIAFGLRDGLLGGFGRRPDALHGAPKWAPEQMREAE